MNGADNQMPTVAIYLGVPKETGGLFQYARTVAHALSRGRQRGYRVVALSPRGTEWAPICASFGLEWREIPVHSPADRVAGRLLRMLGRGRVARRLMSRVTPLGRELDRIGAGVCLYMDSEHYSYELATPSLLPIHDLMHRYESRFEESRAYKAPDELNARICHGAAGILVDSTTGRQQLIESYGPFEAPVHILRFVPPDYVYDESLLPPDPDLPQIVSSVPEKFLFYPAQFWEHKNHIGLVDALMKAAEQCPDIHLVLAGSPKNHYEAVMAHIEQVGAWKHVTYLGFISDAAKAELYRRARAMVLPTFFGPTSIPPLEAFEYGCAALVSDVYGSTEYIADAVLSFDPASVEAMTHALIRIWTDDALHAELVRKGHEHAAAWGPAQFADRLWEIIGQTLEATHTR